MATSFGISDLTLHAYCKVFVKSLIFFASVGVWVVVTFNCTNASALHQYIAHRQREKRMECLHSDGFATGQNKLGIKLLGMHF